MQYKGEFCAKWWWELDCSEVNYYLWCRRMAVCLTRAPRYWHTTRAYSIQLVQKWIRVNSWLLLACGVPGWDDFLCKPPATNDSPVPELANRMIQIFRVRATLSFSLWNLLSKGVYSKNFKTVVNMVQTWSLQKHCLSLTENHKFGPQFLCCYLNQ